MVLFVALVSVFAYLTVGGFIGQFVATALNKRHPRSVWINESRVFGGIFWPLVTPFMIGVGAAYWLQGQDARNDRKEKRRTLEHERRMAEIAAQEKSIKTAMEYLEREGIKGFTTNTTDVYGQEL